MNLDIKKVIVGLLILISVLLLALAPIVGVFIMVLLVAGGGYYFVVYRKKGQQSQSDMELEKYLHSIKASRSMPIIVDTDLDLQKGEPVFLYEKVVFLNPAQGEEKNINTKDSQKKNKYPGFIDGDEGHVALTELRVIFRGNKINMDLPLNVPVKFSSQLGLLFISSGSAEGNTIAFNVHNARIWCEATKIVRNVEDPINMTLQDLDLLSLKN